MPLATDRVPFEEAIGDKLLFKSSWDKLSPPQQVALKIFYGLKLSPTELKYWALFEGFGKFDELGFPTSVEMPPFEYTPEEFDEAWVIFGRRSAKTSGFLAFILAYEALLGGHTAYASPKQQVVSFIVAQKLDIAEAIVRDFIEPIVSSSKLLEKEIVKANINGVFLKNGHRIAPAPPNIKSFRYFAIPVVAMDECSFWYKDAESANPDFEVVRAVEPAQGQFPFHKLMGVSTPWSKEGIIWEASQAGTHGWKLDADDDRKPKYKNSLVMMAPTPALANPLFSSRKWFERQWKKDPEAYRREILVQFTDSVSGMFPESLLRKAQEGSPYRREAKKDVYYVAAMDPAFRADDWAFTIGHYSREEGFVQDLLKKWTPRETKLNPAIILDEIRMDLKEYGLETVYSDQYQLESLQQLAIDRDFVIIGVDFTANSKSKFFGSFLQLLRNERVKLVKDHDQFQQFLHIQRILGMGGYVRISAPSGKHDDLVTVTVLCCASALRMEVEKAPTEAPPATPYDDIMAKLSRPKTFEQEFL